jgi:Domain of unknown function (DUF4340)
MSREKLIIAGVVVLGLLGGLVYKQAKNDEDLGKPQAGATEFPTVSAPEDVDKLSITNGDKPEVVLERVADPTGTPTDAGAPTKWVMTKPVKAEANQQAVTDIVANLKELKAESKVNLKLDDDVRKDKQLDAAHGLHLVAYKGSDKKADETFGKSGPAGQLVVLADKPDAVWAAKGYSAFLYAKDAKDFRKKDIVHFDDAAATQVSVANEHGTFAFTKGDGDKWTGTLNGKAIPRFDGEKVKEMLRAFKGLNAEDFGDGKSLADTGLDKPEAHFSVRLKDDAKDAKLPELLVGAVSTGTNRWVKRDDDDQIFQVTSFASDWTTSDATKFQSAADAGAPPATTASKKK